MIYFNQIKDTRYLVQIILNDNLSFELKITILFKYFDLGKNNIPFKIENKNIDSILVNGKNQSTAFLNERDFLMPTKFLNNHSENIINFAYLGRLERQSLMLSNNFKNSNIKSIKNNFLKLKLPHFNYYTSNFKYRFIATIPMVCTVFYENKPFDHILHNGKRILCYESQATSLRKKLNFIIKPNKKVK